MKTFFSHLSLIVFFFGISLSYAEEATEKLQLRGILDLGSGPVFSLSNQAGSSNWLKIGQNFKGHKLVEYDKEQQLLTLNDGDADYTLTLANAEESTAGTTDDRLAEASRIMQVMNFEKMMDDTMKAQMEATAKMMADQMMKANPNAAADQELIDYQSKVITQMFDGMDWEPIKKSMIELYAEVYTQDQLAGIANFYTSPAGKATLDKLPEVQARSMDILMPAIAHSSKVMHTKMAEFHSQRQQDETKESETK